jgi:hypothetical protein
MLDPTTSIALVIIRLQRFSEHPCNPLKNPKICNRNLKKQNEDEQRKKKRNMYERLSLHKPIMNRIRVYAKKTLIEVAATCGMDIPTTTSAKCGR